MPQTPIFGFPFEQASDVPGITLTGGPSGTERILAEAVEDALINPPDTGWTTVSTGSEWSDDLDYRLRRGIVWIASDVTKDGAVSSEGTEVAIATMPSGARPAQRVETVGFTVLNGTDNSRYFPVRVEPTGEVSMFVTLDSGSLANTASLRFFVSYPV